MIALIDGDVLRYRCGFPADGEPVSHALYNTKKQIKDILSTTEADDYRIYLTGKGNFREEIATILPYKGTRSGRRPEHYDAITDYLLDTWKAEMVEGQEADDAMSIEQWKRWGQGEVESIICTIDKDLDMVPGWHYNFVTEDKFLTGIWGGLDIDRTKSKPKLAGAGLMWFWAQMLMGDRVDNIQGVPGIGDVKAFDILKGSKGEQDLFCRVGKEYAKKYDDPEAAMIENGQLLWMRRKEDEMWSLPI